MAHATRACEAWRMPGVCVLLDVGVLQETALGWLCEVRGRRVFIARSQVETNTTMPREGERGSVSITAGSVSHVLAQIRFAGRRR